MTGDLRVLLEHVLRVGRGWFPRSALVFLLIEALPAPGQKRITVRDEGNGPVARQTPLYLEIDRWADTRRAWFVIL